MILTDASASGCCQRARDRMSTSRRELLVALGTGALAGAIRAQVPPAVRLPQSVLFRPNWVVE